MAANSAGHGGSIKNTESVYPTDAQFGIEHGPPIVSRARSRRPNRVIHRERMAADQRYNRVVCDPAGLTIEVSLGLGIGGFD